MKSKKLLAGFLILVFIISLTGAFAVAENKYIMVNWFNQPDPNAGDTYWFEAEDGSFECIELMPENSATIAYVPPGYNIEAMPRNFDLTVDLMIPDAENGDPESWAGFYLRADQPQTGFGGYLFHVNSYGLGILEAGAPLVDERIGEELLDVSDWNRIRVRLIDKNMKVWINGEEVYSFDNCIPGSGFLGLTTVGFTAKYRNYILITDQETIHSNFIVEGTQPEVVIEEPSAEPSPTTEPTAEPTQQQEATPTPVPTKAVEEKDDTSGDMTTVIIIVIAVLVIAAGAVTGMMIAKKKKN